MRGGPEQETKVSDSIAAISKAIANSLQVLTMRNGAH
jgi:hypothetical protein